MPPLKTRTRAAIALTTAGAIASVAISARGQRIESNRPRTLIVGASRGPAPMERIDAARTGLAHTLLPSGTLRVAWKRTVSSIIDHAPLLGANGDVTLLTSRGDVITLDSDGTERTHVVVGSPALSGGAFLADGTLVFLDGANEAAFVQLGGVRARTRLGGERSAPSAKLSPLPLADGGVVVAGVSDLTTLDAEGNVRAHATLREPIAGPLLTALGKVVAVAASGTVYLWSPSASAREPIRVGAFGGAIEGGAVLDGDHTLLGIVDGAQLVALDLVHGIASPRASASVAGVTFFLGPPALRAGAATFLALTPTRMLLLTVDAAGQETMRQSIASAIPGTLQDGGAPLLTIPPHVGPIVDPRGVIAFAAPDPIGASGEVGVVTASGALDVIGESLCARSTTSSSSPTARAGAGIFAGIVPAGPSAVVVACESGVVAKITAE